MTNHIADLEIASDLTRLRLYIWDFEAKTNPDGTRSGRGAQKRDAYDFFQYEEFWRSESYTDSMRKVRPLTKYKFIKHFTQEEGDTPAEAEDFGCQTVRVDSTRSSGFVICFCFGGC